MSTGRCSPLGMIKAGLDDIDSAAEKTALAKLKMLHMTGEIMGIFTEEMSLSGARELYRLFAREAGTDIWVFYLAVQVVNTFSRDQLATLARNKISVLDLRRMLAIANKRLREKELRKALRERRKQ